jgi:hypothetical protein
LNNRIKLCIISIVTIYISSIVAFNDTSTIINSTTILGETKTDTIHIKTVKQEGDKYVETKEENETNIRLFDTTNGFGPFLAIFIIPFDMFFNVKTPVRKLNNKIFRIGFSYSLFNTVQSSYLSGFGIELNQSSLTMLNRYLGIRQDFGIYFFPGNFENKEYAHNLNGSVYGDVSDKSLLYFNTTIPLNFELLFRTNAIDGTLFLLLGGGGRYVYESNKIRRQNSYYFSSDTLTLEQSNLLPSISIGLGRMAFYKNSMITAQIRYTISINPNKKSDPFPSQFSSLFNYITLMELTALF